MFLLLSYRWEVGPAWGRVNANAALDVAICIHAPTRAAKKSAETGISQRADIV